MEFFRRMAAGLGAAGVAASAIASGGGQASAPAVEGAASALRAGARACAAGASPPAAHPTSKVRHVPVEDAPCAGTSGVAAPRGDMPEALRAARQAAAAASAGKR